MPPAPIVLDPDLAAFLEEGVSMSAASCNAALVPSLARCIGARLSADRTRLSVFLPASHAGEMLADYRANGRIAVVVSKPSTHRTFQLKGEDAAVEPLQDGDHVRIARFREAFVQDLTRGGYRAELAERLLAAARGDVVAVGFTITAAFVQTPGPAAGSPLAR